MKKNTATKWIVFAFDRTDNTPKTGDAANITANVRIDGAGANAVDDTNPAELEDGYYFFEITAAECNGDLIVICPASSTADIQVIGVPGAVWADTLAADLATVDGVADSIKSKTDNLPEDPADESLIIAATNALVTLVGAVPTVAEFEARSLVAADYTVVTDLPAVGPTLAEIEGSTILAKEASLAPLALEASLAPLALEASLAPLALEASLAPLALEASLAPLALEATVAALTFASQASIDLIAADTAAILVDTSATLDAKLDLAVAAAAEIALIHTTVDAILVTTETDLDARVSVLDGKLDTISTAVVTTIPDVLGAVDSNVSDILLDTDELQTDWATAGRLDVILGIAAAAGALDAAGIADAVWDETTAGHVVAGSLGKAVQDAASAGDPWSTPIPGAYAAGTAGKKMSDMAAEVTAVLVDTGTTLDGKINVIDGIVDAILVNTGATTVIDKLDELEIVIDAIALDTGTTLPEAIAAIDVASTPPTVEEISDAVWDEVVSTGHAVGNSAAVKLMAAAAGLATSVAGLGAITCPVTVEIDSVPLQGCDVWITSDAEGTTVVAGTLQTGADGIATFFLDAGTYYVWQQKDGYNFTNPDEFIVT